MRIKIYRGTSEEAKDAERVVFKRPVWMRQLKMFTHRTITGWRMSEETTGYGIPHSHSVSRKGSIKAGKKALMDAGEFKTILCIKDKPKL
jgi:hypothetical protein